MSCTSSYMRHILNRCYLAQLKKYSFVGAENKVIRTRVCKRKGRSRVPVFSETLPVAEHAFASYLSLIYSALDAHAL